MSNDRLPHFASFPNCNFTPWNQHAPHSTPEIDLKWDCPSSTQSFAIGSDILENHTITLLVTSNFFDTQRIKGLQHVPDVNVGSWGVKGLADKEASERAVILMNNTDWNNAFLIQFPCLWFTPH